MNADTIKFEESYKAHNNKLIIEPVEIVSKLGNGMVIQESRGKKDIIVGKVVIPNNGIATGTLVWYPEYAGLPLNLSGTHLIVIDYQDIILTETQEDK